MRLLVVLLVVTLVAVGALVYLADGEAGMVVIQWGPYGFQSTLLVFGVLLVTGYLVVRLLAVLLQQLWRFRFLRRLSAWAARRRAHRQTARGFVHLAEGDWESASRKLEDAADNVNMPLANYVEAARAANKVGDYERRDALLEQAHDMLPERHHHMGLSRAEVTRAQLALGIARAEMQRSRGQLDECLDTVGELLSANPRHLRLLRLKAEVHVAREDWDSLAAMRKVLRKRGVYADDELTELEARIWANKVHTAMLEDADATSLETEWKRLGRRTRANEAFVAGFVRELHDFGDHELAAQTLTRVLNRNWSARLVALYGRTAPADLAAHRKTAEGWLTKHPDDADLTTALGRIALRMDDLPAAREWFEKSLALRNDVEIEGELARVYVTMGDASNGLRLMESAFARLEHRLVDVSSRPPQVAVLEVID